MLGNTNAKVDYSHGTQEHLGQVGHLNKTQHYEIIAPRNKGALALFPGLPTIQFLITCSMENQMMGRPGNKANGASLIMTIKHLSQIDTDNREVPLYIVPEIGLSCIPAG